MIIALKERNICPAFSRVFFCVIAPSEEEWKEVKVEEY